MPADNLSTPAVKRNDGGPAFPRDGWAPEDGMSLRDYFAGQALAGLCANMQVDRFIEMSVGHMAGLSYMYADAMLRERSK